MSYLQDSYCFLPEAVSYQHTNIDSLGVGMLIDDTNDLISDTSDVGSVCSSYGDFLENEEETCFSETPATSYGYSTDVSLEDIDEIGESRECLNDEITPDSRSDAGILDNTTTRGSLMRSRTKPVSAL